jgi:hypothetical protein
MCRDYLTECVAPLRPRFRIGLMSEFADARGLVWILSRDRKGVDLVIKGLVFSRAGRFSKD